ncbi:unnamed protein product [Closterium sp. NIES-65]|nr:unnamed protein product [Closterium sp. NIES-65]
MTAAQSPTDAQGAGGDYVVGKTSQAVSLPDAWRERFRDLITTHLRMDGAMQQQAMELFSACYALLAPSLASFGAPESPDDSERAWSACVLFVVRKLGPAKAAEEAAARAGEIAPPGSSRSQWPWFTLSELLRATKLTVVDFFKEIANFLPRVSPVMQAAYGDLWEQRLEVKELQANFVHAIVLFNHYKKVFAELFISSPPPSLPSGAPAPPAAAATSQFSREMRFGWLLFLSIKAHLLRRFPDLVTATNAMLCTLVVLIVHVPPSLRRFSFSDPVRFSRRAGRERLVDVVGSLCASYKAAEGEVSALLDRTQQLMARCLTRQAAAASCEQHDAGELCPDRLFLFEGLLQDAAALPSVDLVEGAYQEAYVEAGDRALDERMFLSGDGQVIGAVSQLTAATSAKAGDRALDERMFLSGDGQVIGAVSQLTAATSVAAAKVSGTERYCVAQSGICHQMLSGDRQVIGAVSQLTAASTVGAFSAPTGAMNAPSSPFASGMGAGGGAGGEGRGGGSTTITIAPFCSPARSFLTRLGPGGMGGTGGTGAGGGGGGGGMGVPQTPISAAMSTAHWLRTVVSASPAEPSLDLLRFLHACDKDVTGAVVTRTTLVSHEIFSAVSQKKRAAAAAAAAGAAGGGGGKGAAGEAGGEKNGTGAGAGDAGKQADGDAAAGGGGGGAGGGSEPAEAALWAEQRRQETVKLYYRVLLRMCTSESLRINSQNLTPLLDNDRFHRALLACSAELVLASHKATAHAFPAVLAPAGVSAFDMDKVMEGFVRYEEGLPGELKRHLNACDERILESLAWEKGSSLYVTVVAARRHLLAEVRRLQLLPEGEEGLVGRLMGRGVGGKGGGGDGERGDGTPESKGSDEAQASFPAFSPMKPQNKREFAHLHSSFTTPFQRASAAAAPPGESRSEMLFNQFCQKVLKLAVVRVRSLCERLRLTAAVSEMVFRVVEHAVEGEVQLLFCRHLDQIILSSVYGVCKVSQVAVTFKDIIAQYRKLPHCKPSVFRNVFIDAKPPPADSASKEPIPQHGDIIRFYNEIFIPAAKSFLLHLGFIVPFSPCFLSSLSTSSPPPPPCPPHQPIPQHGDIIRFYNEIFVPATKSFLLHLGHGASTAGGAAGGAGERGGGHGGSMFRSPLVHSSPALAHFQQHQQSPSSVPGASPRRVSSRHNVYVSPLPTSRQHQQSPSSVPGASPRRVSSRHNVYVSPLPTSRQHQQSPSSVPGASPRRVSSRHNVYVSPLPTSRMEALLASPHRQLSAQLSTQLLGGGLSADPFASPSRHIAAINQRISSSR